MPSLVHASTAASAAPHRSPAELHAALRRWVADTVAAQRAGGVETLDATHWLAGGALLDHVTAVVDPVPCAGAIPVAVSDTASRTASRRHVADRVRAAQTEGDLLSAVQSSADPDHVLAVVRDCARHTLVTPAVLAHCFTGSARAWATMREVGYPNAARAWWHARLADALHDATHPDAVPALLAVGEQLRRGYLAEGDVLLGIVCEIAEGRGIGVVGAFQRHALLAMLPTPWVSPSMLAAILALRDDAGVHAMVTAIGHARATPAIWSAAARGPYADRLAGALSRMPAACALEVVWPAILAAVDNLAWPPDELMAMTERVLAASAGEGCRAAFARMVTLSPDRAVTLLGRMSRRRLHALTPDDLMPLLQSTVSAHRLAAVQALTHLTVSAGAPGSAPASVSAAPHPTSPSGPRGAV
jgi:hypothetical protein